LVSFTAMVVPALIVSRVPSLKINALKSKRPIASGDGPVS
jgi:hypothetical protein